MKEDDIRPDHLMAKAFELLEQDTARLMQDVADFVEVPCPACEGLAADPFAKKRGMTFVRCQSCRTVWGNPRPSRERLARYYREATYYDYWNRHIYPLSDAARREKIFRPRVTRLLELCEKYRIPQRCLVEVGAGYGTFCEELAHRGAFERVIAVEPTPSSAQSCRQRGVEVIETPISQVTFGKTPVDVLATFEVVEHLFAPKEFLEQCARVLCPGGLLVVTCPNIEGFDLVVLKEVADTITPEHLNYFHPASLSRLMTGVGLEVLEVTTPGQLDAEIVRKKTLKGDFDLAANPFLKKILVDEWDDHGAAFQAFLADHGLSSHMWLVAKKTGA